MKIVFSFDDGRSDAYEAYQILKKHKLCGSFHITTGFIDNTFVTDAFGYNRTPLTKEQLLEMNLFGMDISSHGDKHIMDVSDFKTSIKKLRDFSIVNEKYGFSVPNSDYSKEELENFIKQNYDELSYVRVGRSKKCYSFISKISYVFYHLLHFQCFFNLFNKHNLLTSINQFEINSLVVLSDSKSKNLIKFIRKYKDKNVVLVLMFHSIIEKPTNKWEYSKKEFESICEYVSHNCECATLSALVTNK